MTDDQMREYVRFIARSMKGEHSVRFHNSEGRQLDFNLPVATLDVLETDLRTATFRMMVFGDVLDFTHIMSRRKSPERLFWEVKNKMNEKTDEAINRNLDMDRDEIWTRRRNEGLSKVFGREIKMSNKPFTFPLAEDPYSEIE